MLDDLATESSIKDCDWYIPELNDKKKEIITRAQRVKYAVQAGLPDDFVSTTLKVDVGRATQKYTKLIERLSAFTHINATTFDITKSAERKLADEALTTFVLVLKTIDDCRSRVESKVERRAKDALTDELFAHSVDALEEIATHHTVHGAEIEELNLKSMDSATIVFSATGFLDCELQYGSDGDYSRGDGLRVEDSYPLKCKLVADISTPLDLEVQDLRVDNSSFYE
jgi:hypothetical protein